MNIYDIYDIHKGKCKKYSFESLTLLFLKADVQFKIDFYLGINQKVRRTNLKSLNLRLLGLLKLSTVNRIKHITGCRNFGIVSF